MYHLHYSTHLVRGRRPLAWVGEFIKCFTQVQWPIPKLPTSLHDGKAGSQSQVQHIFDWLILHLSWLWQVKNQGGLSLSFQELLGRRAEYSCPDGGQVQACWTRTVGQFRCSALCPRQKAEPWMEAKGWSYLSKSVRQANPKAKINWFYRCSWYHLGGNASQGGCWRALLLWSPCR